MYKLFARKTKMSALLLLATAATFLAIVPAQAGNAFGIAGNTPGFIQKANDLGAVDPNSVIAITVWLQLHNEKNPRRTPKKEPAWPSAQQVPLRTTRAGYVTTHS